jgi:hypothetical protein
VTPREKRRIAETYRADQTAFAFARLRHLARLVVAGDPAALDVARTLNGDSPDAGAMLAIERGEVVMRGGWLGRFWAETFADSFLSTGATNYLAVTMATVGHGRWSVVIQREDGLTPAEKLHAAELQRDKLASRVAVLEDQLAALRAKRVKR